MTSTNRKLAWLSARVRGVRVTAMRLHQGAVHELPVLSRAWGLAARAEVIDRAGSLALFAILAAVPALFGLFSVLGFLFDTVGEVADLSSLGLESERPIIERLSAMMNEALPGATLDPSQLATALVKHRTANGVAGTTAALVLGMTVFSRLDAAVRAVFVRRKRSAWRAAGLMGLLFLIASLGAMVLVVAAPLADWGLAFAARSVETLSMGWIDGVSTIVTVSQVLPISIGFFVLVRWSAGKGRVGKRRLLIMAMTYGAIWIAGQQVFSLYVSEIMQINVVYGALAALMALMLWIYYATVAFLCTVAILAAWEQVARGEDWTVGTARAHTSGRSVG